MFADSPVGKTEFIFTSFNRSRKFPSRRQRASTNDDFFMASLRNILLLFCFALALGSPLASNAVAAPTGTAITQSNAANREAVAPEKDAETTLQPAVIAHIGPFPITNAMLVTWGVAILVIVFAQVAMRRVESVPSGLQNLCEWLVQSLRDFLEDLLGRHLVQKTFWFFATLFIFIVAIYWFALVPGVGTIGWGHYDAAQNFHVTRPLLRAPTSDLNMTLSMALLFFLLWIIWAFQEAGAGGIIKHIFGPKMPSKGILKLLLILMFFAIGCLEVISILFRPVSLSFRLYGNAFAGESLLEMMTHISRWLAWLLPIPIYLLEIVVGLIQAFVFMLLCAVFTFLICNDEDKHSPSH